MNKKVREFLINTALVLLSCTLLLIMALVLENYNKAHYLAESAKNDLKASEYRMQTEMLKRENAKVQLEVSEAHLKAFIKVYSKEE